MKKYLMFVLALLFTFVLASCELNINQNDLSNSSETSQESTISDLSEIKDEIIDAYKSKYNLEYDIEIGKIYGVFYKDSKLVIPFIQGGPGDAIAWGETVANIYFYYGDHHRIEVYYDNDFYTLQEAYDNGLLTQENIIEMARNDENHCKMGHSWYNTSAIPEIYTYTCFSVW